MKLKIAILAVLASAASPAFAQGDATKGEAVFRQCQTCHLVANEAGEVLAGNRAKTGPNLYGVFGRQAGTYPDFNYGDDLVAAGEAGLIWDEASFVEYAQDPAAFLKTTLDDRSARSKMSFKLRKAEDATNLYAFLAQFSPEPAEATEGTEAPADAPAATSN
jgi:cytochrome c